LVEFPEFLKESVKSKLKNSETQTIMRENQTKKAVFLFFGFFGFNFGFPRFLFGYKVTPVHN
jgi:hypothetical protein